MGINAGAGRNAVPAPFKSTLSTNYIDFTSAGTKGWAQQYLPDLMESEAEVYGNRTISGFLSQVGAEESMSSDQVIWTEQGRLHASYAGAVAGTAVITLTADVDGNALNAAGHMVRVGDMVIVAGGGGQEKCYVSAVDATTITALPYASATLATAFPLGTELVNIMVYGSEYGKGTTGRVGAIKPAMHTFTNKPIILKDMYEVSGSDASQIGWVEVSGEAGQDGYLWYLKAEGDTRARFTDYLEMSMVESVKGDPATSTADSLINGAAETFGTEGLFAAIEARGNMSNNTWGVSPSTDLAEFDAILAEFDSQGAIEENMLFLNRASSLAFDDMLASVNANNPGQSSYGVFQNSESMALNLGFMGFRRGSYDFYKSDWKYLNDKGTRGGLRAFDGINGLVVPAGVSSVYDQQLGKNLKRPFLHVRYRASQMEDRYLKTWVTGSVGASTSDLDAMEIHYLSERCLIVQGANNFMLFN
tara:strand:+ start:2207 stop:3631 length:1425 start_codon:yes stop_codon:yes gene_type:complete